MRSLSRVSAVHRAVCSLVTEEKERLCALRSKHFFAAQTAEALSEVFFEAEGNIWRVAIGARLISFLEERQRTVMV